MERWEALICVTHAAPLPITSPWGHSLCPWGHHPQPQEQLGQGISDPSDRPARHELGLHTVGLSLAAHGEHRPCPCPQARSEPRKARLGDGPSPSPPGDQGVQAGAEGAAIGWPSRSATRL